MPLRKLLGGLSFFPQSDFGRDFCPLRITRENVDSFREDPRFSRMLARINPPPGGLCSATEVRGFLRECPFSNSKNCSRRNHGDLCDAAIYGGDTYEAARRRF